ncbi:MAG: FAD:protein FMN transferase [Lachnospiraceae bacterium]|nr:FAD:protein FMN transferase [Lachnospiraceae bacterium]
MTKGKTVRVLSVAVLILMLVLMLIYTGSGHGRECRRDIFAMNTYMTVSVTGKDCEAAAEEAVREIERLDRELSATSDSSKVAQLNKEGRGIVSTDMMFLFNTSKKVYDMTGGGFDITTYPLKKAWGFDTGEYRIPSEEELHELLPLVDMRLIEVNEDSGEIVMPEGMETDFGGIAKGYAADRIVGLLKNYDIDSAIINLGGNVRVYGSKDNGEAYRVAIRCPEEYTNVVNGSGDDRDYLGILSVNDKAVITSGSYERFFEYEGKKYHHIIDPATGYPVDSGLVSVTVIGEDGATCDALSTGIFVGGLDMAKAFYSRFHEDYDLILLDEDGTIYATEGVADDLETDGDLIIIRKADS